MPGFPHREGGVLDLGRPRGAQVPPGTWDRGTGGWGKRPITSRKRSTWSRTSASSVPAASSEVTLASGTRAVELGRRRAQEELEARARACARRMSVREMGFASPRSNSTRPWHRAPPGSASSRCDRPAATRARLIRSPSRTPLVYRKSNQFTSETHRDRGATMTWRLFMLVAAASGPRLSTNGS